MDASYLKRAGMGACLGGLGGYYYGTLAVAAVSSLVGAVVFPKLLNLCGHSPVVKERAAQIQWDDEPGRPLTLGERVKRAGKNITLSASNYVKATLHGSADSSITKVADVSGNFLKGKIGQNTPLPQSVVNYGLDSSVGSLRNRAQASAHGVIDSQVDGSVESVDGKVSQSVDSSVELGGSASNFLSRITSWFY